MILNPLLSSSMSASVISFVEIRLIDEIEIYAVLAIFQAGNGEFKKKMITVNV